MAERRMFAKTIIDSDAFLDMPLSTQALYFHLSMRADDDGFVNNPKKIQRMVGASDDDCKLLILKRFILTFESGVIVIKHWKIHNYIQKDRYKPTIYQAEKALLNEKENKAYTECIHDGYIVDTQDSIGKDSLDKSKVIDIEVEPEKKPNTQKEQKSQTINYKQITDLYNDTCVSLQKVKALSESRKKTIKARLNTYSLEDIKTVFEKAESSDFLKGKNDRSWQANFDWLMTDRNFAKVIDGNYDNKPCQSTKQDNLDFDRKFGTVL